jgi:inosine-uridine nucleoside N-ribohydrolase
MTKLILDVDTGVDDALAIALATTLDLDLIGITTVAGNVPVELATRNTLDVLAWLGRTDVEVHRGASRPLATTYQDATHVHGGNGLGGVSLPRSTVDEVSPAGPAYIIESALQFGEDLTLVTLGPLTNLAIAINVRPEIVHNIGRVVVMGGSYLAAGNVTPHAEFNVFGDPDAASQVFGAPWNDLTLVGLDVTHHTVFARQAWEQVDRTIGPAAALVHAVMDRTFTKRDMSGFYLHDPLAVAVANDPTLVEGVRRRVEVVTSGETRGKTTLGDEYERSLVSTSVDAARFVRDLASALGLPDIDHMEGMERPE